MEYWFEVTTMNEDVCKELQKEYNGVTDYDIHIKYSKNADGLCTLYMVSNAKNEEENIAAKKMFDRIWLEDTMKMVFGHLFGHLKATRKKITTKGKE